jgi:hypothetical protein
MARLARRVFKASPEPLALMAMMVRRGFKV